MVKTLELGNNMLANDDSSRIGDFQYRSGGIGEDGVEKIRVWRTSWFDDMFEVLTLAEFEEFKKWADRFSFQVVEAED